MPTGWPAPGRHPGFAGRRPCACRLQKPAVAAPVRRPVAPVAPPDWWILCRADRIASVRLPSTVPPRAAPERRPAGFRLAGNWRPDACRPRPAEGGRGSAAFAERWSRAHRPFAVTSAAAPIADLTADLAADLAAGPVVDPTAGRLVPVDPAAPVDPAGPAAPVDPAAPAVLAGLADPVDLAVPADLAAPAGRRGSTGPAPAASTCPTVASTLRLHAATFPAASAAARSAAGSCAAGRPVPAAAAPVASASAARRRWPAASAAATTALFDWSRTGSSRCPVPGRTNPPDPVRRRLRLRRHRRSAFQRPPGCRGT